jgi:hypothetical protein
MKVVPDYDFEFMGLIDKLQSVTFMVGIGLLALVLILGLESYWWHAIYIIPIFSSGVFTLIYDNLASEISANIYGTRIYGDGR